MWYETRRFIMAAILGALAVAPAAALVHYDQGQRIVLGVQLLQDASDPDTYYYLPQSPRLASKDDGTLELLCLKYVDPDGGTHGGLFHALVELTLEPEIVEKLEQALRKEVPKARIAGPVPLMQAVEDGAEGMGTFQVVSAILADTGEGGLTRSLITSGRAPLTPGSKAVVAAMLDQRGATLLWESLSGPTSDVSVSVHATYEAAVKAYNARVSAEVSMVYEHLSRLTNIQKGYTRRHIRDVVDELQRDGGLEIEVLDRTRSLGIEAKEMEGILELVTDKLTELMFDSESGWAKEPEREAAVEAGQLPGRQQRSWLSRTFGRTRDTPYVTDNQYVLKKRKDIRRNTFTLQLGKETTVKVPFDTAGNLGGIYDELGKDERYFRVVDLDDPDFELHRVHFQVDGEYVDAFQDTINFVTVSVRKLYPAGERPAFTRTLTWSHADIKDGKTIREITFPRLGATDAGWSEYEYQARFSLRDLPTVAVPAEEGKWIKSRDAAIALVPPFTRRTVEVEAAPGLLDEDGFTTAVVEFATVLAGEPRLQRKVTLRASDSEAVEEVSLYHDRDEPDVAYRVSWYSQRGLRRGELELLDSDFLFLLAPDSSTEEGP